MDRKTRNKAIKSVLEQAFGRGKVSVRSGKGTSWSWAYVDIAYKPRDRAEWTALYHKVHALIRAAKIDVGHFYSDGPEAIKMPEVLVTFAH